MAIMEEQPKSVPNRGPDGRLLKGHSLKRLRNPEDVVPFPDEDQLTVMRFVAVNPSDNDMTPAQRACRKWMQKDPKGFWKAKTDLEVKEDKGKPVKESGPGYVDEGIEKSLVLLDELLKSRGWEK